MGLYSFLFLIVPAICWYLFVITWTLEHFKITTFGHPKEWLGLPAWFKFSFSKFVTFFQPNEVIWAGRKPQKNEKVIFVVNHQLSGLDIPIAIASIYLQTGIWPRGLQDRIHYKIPVFKHLTWILGAFVGDRQTCQQAMDLSYPLLVYPGGADEIWRSSKIPRYTLQWKEKKGFARMALQNGYTLFPVSLIGMDDMLSIVFELPGKLLMKIMGDKRSNRQEFYLPFFLPNFKFQKQYIRFGNPVVTEELKENVDEDNITKVRDQVRDEMLQGLDELKKIQAQDEKRYLSLKSFFE
ncbi:hypothetical protein BC833DRAFT_565919 [Globomyces pollinis-pini]|nr:hypothetical protein BC833DRAFT_565919 [Globomyces pollinis-pini]KAJ2998242.1 hypothetical protein HDV02_004662 [Globomyces sp. JEL0801]